MSDSQKRGNSRENPNFANLLSITLLSWLVLLPIVNTIELPFTENDTGIISTVAIDQFSPYTDYLKFAILLFVPAAIAFCLSQLNSKLKAKCLDLIVKVIENKTLVSIFTIGLILIWSVDRMCYDFGMPLVDTFHEGEYLGYLPNFTQLDKPFLQSIFIHGFGLDTVPSLLAHWWVRDGENEIAMTRFFYTYTSIFAMFGYFWILWEIVSLFFIKSRHYIFIFLIVICCLFEKYFFFLDGGRSLIFTINLALTLRYFRLSIALLKSVRSDCESQVPLRQGRQRGLGVSPSRTTAVNSGRSSGSHPFEKRYSSKRAAIQKLRFLSFWVGVLIPIGFLHTYDRALYFLMTYLFVSALSFSLEKKVYSLWIRYSILGIGFSCFLIVSILGISQFTEILSQVSYWSQYSRYMFSLPMPELKINWVNQLYWLPMLVQSMTLMYLTYDLIQNPKIKEFIQKHFFLFVTLFVSLLHMRVPLDRSNLIMAGQGGFWCFILITYLSLNVYNLSLKNKFIVFFHSPDRKIILVAILFALIAAEPGFALSNLSGRFDNLTKSNSEILQPAHLELLETFKADIDRQSCFYTANTEGIWYYLFDKPSCSKFGNLYYALPTVAQEVVARELEATQPDRILLTDGIILTGRPIADTTPIIFQYILDRYRPDRLIAERWMWKRNETPLELTRDTASIGTLDRWCIAAEDRECLAMPEPGDRQKLRRGKPIYTVEGSAILPEQNRPADAVYLSYGNSDRLVTAARVNGDGSWSLTVPSMTLPLGKEIVRVWAYDAEGDRLRRIGYDLEIKIVR